MRSGSDGTTSERVFFEPHCRRLFLKLLRLGVFCDDTCPTATGLLGLRHMLVIDNGKVAAPALIVIDTITSHV